MRIVSEWQEMLTDARERRKAILVLAAAPVAFGLSWEALRQSFLAGPMSPLGAPIWAWGIMLGLACVFVWIGEYARHLRRTMAQKIALSLDGGCQSDTEQTFINPDGTVKKSLPTRFIRVKATNQSEMAALECEAYLIDANREDGAGGWLATGFHDTMDLAWSFRNVAPIKIGKGVRRYIDVMNADAENNKLNCRLPNRNRDLFQQPGRYRIKIGVLCDGVATERWFVIKWTGTWNETEITEDV